MTNLSKLFVFAVVFIIAIGAFFGLALYVTHLIPGFALPSGLSYGMVLIAVACIVVAALTNPSRN